MLQETLIRSTSVIFKRVEGENAAKQQLNKKNKRVRREEEAGANQLFVVCSHILVIERGLHLKYPAQKHSRTPGILPH